MLQSESGFAEAYSMLAAGVSLSDLESGLFLDVNTAFGELTGYSRQELVGASAMALQMWEPGQREELISRLRGGPVRNLELRVKHRSGKHRIALLSADIVAIGDRRCLLATAFDITEWRATEAAFRRLESRQRAVVEALPSLTIILDRDGRYGDVLAGPGMHELLIAPAHQLSGRTLHEVMPKEHADRFLGVVRDAIDSNATRLIEYEIEVQAGMRWFEARIAPYRDDANKDKVVWMAHDITPRKEAETQLRQVAEQRRNFARQLISIQEKERERLARELHDDLGQVLTALKLECRTIADRAEDPERVRRGIEGLSERLNLAMTSVRNLVRGLHPNVLTDIGLGAALDSMCRRITDSTALACNVEVPAAADRLPTELASAVYRIAQEALTNVVRHSGADRVWLRLECEPDRVTLTVEDDGSGASGEELAARHTLGMISMRERAELLRGQLLVERSPRGGLRVQATVPLEAGQLDPP